VALQFAPVIDVVAADMATVAGAQAMVSGRPGTPDEVASFVEWLLGADGGWVTGQVLSPNGGAVLGR
jgi:3-oxoacyl-[acyl-carrier protein] reductase